MFEDPITDRLVIFGAIIGAFVLIGVILVVVQLVRGRPVREIFSKFRDPRHGD